MKVVTEFILFCSLFFCNVIAYAASEDMNKVKEMVTIPESILNLEKEAQDHPRDTPELKRIKSNLRISIENYKSVVNDIRKKYGGWIETSQDAKKIRDEIQKKQDGEYGKIAANYFQLGLLSINQFLFSPKGSKGGTDVWNDSIRLQIQKNRIDSAQYFFQQQKTTNSSSSSVSK